jgi:vacuolar-type H+-ATPase subunit I/STV1
MKGYVMGGRYIVRTYKNGVKHFFNTDTGRCIHWSKVKERIPKEEFDELFEQFNDKQSKKKNVAEPLPKLSDMLSDVINVYSEKISIEEIVGALELCKIHALTLNKTKN